MWDIQVTGDLPADPRRPYVVVCNHQSLADIPVISRLPWEMKWVAKDVLFRLPFAGWMMKLAGDIEVARGDKRSRAEVLVKARRMLDRRCSVMLFPEGTRSRDGQVGTFAHGAFRLAIKAGVPVLPLAIDGTLDALPKNRWTFDQMDAPMRLKVLPPVPTDGLKLSDAPVLTEQVRGMVVKQLATWRGAPVEAIDGGEAGADFSRPSG
jgi:1-acyl-sn-glycerol-3-phosphate acyltransferase